MRGLIARLNRKRPANPAWRSVALLTMIGLWRERGEPMRLPPPMAYAAMAVVFWAAAQCHGSSSATCLAGCVASLARTSLSQAAGSMRLSLAVSVSE